MTAIQKRLFELSDEKYADFQSRLTPGIDREQFIGVRVPVLRKYAAELAKSSGCEEFLNSLPHEYYDENMLHGLLVSGIKDYETAVRRIDEFLPFVDNWAVCDIMSPKCFRKNRERLLGEIRRWSRSGETYTCRFGLEMLMSHYLDEDFREEYLEIPASVKSDEYYVNMMIAWFFATALAKQWDSTVRYIEEPQLDEWVHNKAIQKARESYRITDEQKRYLNTLKR